MWHVIILYETGGLYCSSDKLKTIKQTGKFKLGVH